MRQHIAAILLALILGSGAGWVGATYMDGKQIAVRDQALGNLHSAWVSMCRGSNIGPSECEDGWLGMVTGQ